MTIYYDAFLNGLIPVKFKEYAIDAFGDVRSSVEVLKSVGAYTKGETLIVPPSALVNKAGRKGIHQLVTTAILQPK